MAFRTSGSVILVDKPNLWTRATDDDSTLLDEIDHEVHVLQSYHDWDEWCRDIQTHIDVHLWEHMWSEEPQCEILSAPSVPSVQQFNIHARDVSELTKDEFEQYHKQNKIYFSKKEKYDLQNALVQKAKGLISRTVSPDKAKLLDEKSSLREWRILLERDTAPTLQQRVAIERARYEDVLEKLDLDSEEQDWAYEWYNAITRCHRLNMPETHCGTWLRDVADCILPYSTKLYERFEHGADKLDLLAINWRRKAEQVMTSQNEERPAAIWVPGSNHMGSSSPSSRVNPSDNTQDNPGGGKVWTFLEVYREIRDIDLSPSEDGNLAGKAASMKESPQCPACGLKGHELRHCWYAFEVRRPEGVAMSRTRLRRVEKAIKMDTDLAQRVADIYDGFTSGRFYQRQLMLRNQSEW